MAAPRVGSPAKTSARWGQKGATITPLKAWRRKALVIGVGFPTKLSISIKSEQISREHLISSRV